MRGRTFIRMNNTIAWSQNAWLPYSHVRFALDDFGLLQSAVLVDRLRTVRSLPLDADDHIERLVVNAATLGINIPESMRLAQLVRQCAEKNQEQFDCQDFSIVTLVTPGRVGDAGREPTIIIHAAALPWERLDHWYQHGQDLIVASARNVPAACWPIEFKTRARLHYYLADRQADAVINKASAHAGAVLLDLEGNLTDTSTANLMLVEDNQLVTAPPQSCYQGFSLQRTLRLANELGIAVRREPISVERATAARQILLCGSVGMLWCARSFDGQLKLRDSSVFDQLKQAWISDIGLDFVDQSRRILSLSH